MKKSLTIIALSVFTSVGCAHHQQAADAAFDGIDKGLAGFAVGVQASREPVEEATNARIAKCQDAEDREACMGLLGKPVGPIYDKIGTAYDAAVKAMDVLEEAYGELAPIVEEAMLELTK